jgi:hypothetical protein
MKKLLLAFLVAAELSLFNNNVYSQIPAWLWAKGETGSESVNSVAVDPSGNLFVAGYFTGKSVTFGSITLTNSHDLASDLFLAKYDSNGTVQWAISAGDYYTDEATSVAVDAAGNAYLTGYWYGDTITFGSYSLHNTYHSNADIFLVKYNPDGNVLWAKSAGDNSSDQAKAVAVDALGNVFITGWFQWSIKFGTVTLQNADHTGYGSPDIFLAKYNSDGDFQWANSAQGMLYDESKSIAVDNVGNTYVTGYFASRTITFDNIILANTDSDTTIEWPRNDIFVAKYNAEGKAIWAKSAGGTKHDEGKSVAVDAESNVYLSGYFASDTIDFGEISLINSNIGATYTDLFLAKYDKNGNIQWAKNAAGTNPDIANAITFDKAGNLYQTGYTSSQSITFGTITNMNTSYESAFITKYDTEGEAIWVIKSDGKSWIKAQSIAVCKENIYIGGNFTGLPVFGNDTLTNDGGMFIAKCGLTDPTGIKEIDNSSCFNVYPNPAKSDIVIKTQHEAVVEIFNIQGKLLHKFKSNNNTTFDISNYPIGVYLLKVTTNKNCTVRKLIKE